MSAQISQLCADWNNKLITISKWQESSQIQKPMNHNIFSDSKKELKGTDNYRMLSPAHLRLSSNNSQRNFNQNSRSHDICGEINSLSSNAAGRQSFQMQESQVIYFDPNRIKRKSLRTIEKLNQDQQQNIQSDGNGLQIKNFGYRFRNQSYYDSLFAIFGILTSCYRRITLNSFQKVKQKARNQKFSVLLNHSLERQKNVVINVSFQKILSICVQTYFNQPVQKALNFDKIESSQKPHRKSKNLKKQKKQSLLFKNNNQLLTSIQNNMDKSDGFQIIRQQHSHNSKSLLEVPLQIKRLISKEKQLRYLYHLNPDPLIQSNSDFYFHFAPSIFINQFNQLKLDENRILRDEGYKKQMQERSTSDNLPLSSQDIKSNMKIAIEDFHEVLSPSKGKDYQIFQKQQQKKPKYPLVLYKKQAKNSQNFGHFEVQIRRGQNLQNAQKDYNRPKSLTFASFSARNTLLKQQIPSMAFQNNTRQSLPINYEQNKPIRTVSSLTDFRRPSLMLAQKPECKTPIDRSPPQRIISDYYGPQPRFLKFNKHIPIKNDNNKQKVIFNYNSSKQLQNRATFSPQKKYGKNRSPLASNTMQRSISPLNQRRLDSTEIGYNQSSYFYPKPIQAHRKG